MPRVDINAETYASKRLGIFFPANGETPNDGNLTGQCVTLNKWFLAEMTNVPSPFAARGDARYVGQTLVAQGHAVVVPYNERKPGDFAIFEYGQYGHIGVCLTGNRLFEQNVNAGGAARRVLADGTVVYASRIGTLDEPWRPVRATIYRIKSYSEEGIMTDDQIRRTCLYLRLAAGQSVEQANANSDNDLRQIKANPDYLPALAKQIYQGNELFRWKAAHYDEQVKVAFEKGKLAGGNDTSDYVPVSEYGGKPTLYVKLPQA